jgi:hypothetical protein
MPAIKGAGAIGSYPEGGIMPLEEAIELVKQSEAREHRCNGVQRGRLIHEAFEAVIKAAEKEIKK